MCVCKLYYSMHSLKDKECDALADMKPIIWNCRDVWEVGKLVGLLVKGVEDKAKICGFRAGHNQDFEVEPAGHFYKLMLYH